jgi:hypothetical protein
LGVVFADIASILVYRTYISYCITYSYSNPYQKVGKYASDPTKNQTISASSFDRYTTLLIINNFFIFISDNSYCWPTERVQACSAAA